jgi:hypothetical protein
MRRLLTFGVVIALWRPASAIGVQQDSIPPLQRVIPDSVRIPQTFHPCTASATVANLARRMHVIAGVEHPLDCSRWAQEAFDDAVSLNGATVEQLLDALVEQNPKSRRVFADGVIVMRPLQFFGDQRNVLNQPVGTFELEDVHMGGAMGAILERLLGDDEEVPLIVVLRVSAAT